MPYPQSGSQPSFERTRAISRMLLAIVVFLVSRAIATRGAHGLASGPWEPMLEQAMLAFLLLLGFSFLGYTQDRQAHPIAEQGLVQREGWGGETALGLALGWAMALASLTSIVLAGGLVVRLNFTPGAFGWLLVDGCFFAVSTLVVTLAFQGYPLQTASRAFGDSAAAMLLAILYGLVQINTAGASRASTAFCFAFGLLLGIAYLRTRALWLPWGLHFGWIAAQALLFGLPVNGVTAYSPVVQCDAYAREFFSGGPYGLQGSWFAVLLALAAIPVLLQMTSDLHFRHNAPKLVPGGIPVDLDSLARRQHEAATREQEPAAPPLVQILPAGPAAGTTPAAEVGSLTQAVPGLAGSDAAGTGDSGQSEGESRGEDAK